MNRVRGNSGPGLAVGLKNNRNIAGIKETERQGERERTVNSRTWGVASLADFWRRRDAVRCISRERDMRDLMCQLTRKVAVSDQPMRAIASARLHHLAAQTLFYWHAERREERPRERERERTRARGDPRRSVRELSVKLVKFNFGFSTSDPEGPVGRNGAGNDKWRGARTQITRTRGPLAGIKSFF